MSWAGNTVGWFGVLLLIQRPLWELITLLAANTAVTVGFLAADGALDHVTVSRLLAMIYTTAGIQLTFAYLARQLNDGARKPPRSLRDRRSTSPARPPTRPCTPSAGAATSTCASGWNHC